MSLTPQDNARTAYSRTNPQQIVFSSTPNIATASPSQRTNYPRATQGSIRPQNQHQSPYQSPFAPNSAQAGPPRQNGNKGVSAEQQIAQGVLSNSAAGSGSNTPQRRPPPLGTIIHMAPNVTPQNQPMNINHAVNPISANQNRDFGQRQSQNGSPAHQILGAQRPSMNASPVNSNLGRPQDSPNNGMDTTMDTSMDTTQDMSMIDPQLALDQQIMNDANNSMVGQRSPSPQHVVQGEMLSPPPGGSYPTFEALFAAAQAHALAHGYAFVIGRSKRDNRGLKKVFLICDRGGNNKEKVPGEQRQRKTKSRKCGCEFGVFGLENKTAWLLRGRIDGEHLTHNHPPSDSPTEHPGARKLDPKAIAAVKALEENGMWLYSIR